MGKIIEHSSDHEDDFDPDALLLLSFAIEDSRLSLEELRAQTGVDVTVLKKLLHLNIYPWRIPVDSFISLVQFLQLDLLQVIDRMHAISVTAPQDSLGYRQELDARSYFLNKLKQHIQIKHI